MMKRWLRALPTGILAVSLILGCPAAAADVPAPQTAPAEESDLPDLSADAVYQKLIAFQETYPEGTSYTDDDYYIWHGDLTIGFGCVGFAFMLSDAAFGDLPAREFTDYTQLRVGDLLRMNYDAHTVIVLEIHDNYIKVAEGNYNGAVHWGRIIPMSEVFGEGTVYGTTRYPEGWQYIPPAPIPGDINGDRQLTVTDAIILLRVLAEDPSFKVKKPEQIEAADLDGDGMLTLLDSKLLLRQLEDA